MTARSTYAGVGTRLAKLRLNKLAKTSVYAKALRLALEIEDRNLTAKRYFGGDIGGYTYSEINYCAKVEGINQLIEIAKSEGWIWGVQKSGIGDATHVIYFEIPGVGQVSWHYTPSAPDLPTYPGEWDRQVNSTLRKLEPAIQSAIGQCEKAQRATGK